MSALPPKADIDPQSANVRFVPKADIPESGGLRQRDDLIDVLFDGGVQRGTHILKAISLGAKAVGVEQLLDYRGQPQLSGSLVQYKVMIRRSAIGAARSSASSGTSNVRISSSSSARPFTSFSSIASPSLG
jgi:hypothetical protein